METEDKRNEPAHAADKGEDAAKHGNHLPMTTGEKWFNRLRFGIGEVFILFFTAIIAYHARHHETWGWGSKRIPNPLKVFQKHAEKGFDRLLNVEKLKEKLPFLKRVSTAFAGTLVTFHGGNLFAPVMKGINDHKTPIVAAINRRHGKPGEVEAGEERMKKEPRQTWGDVFKGRIAGFTIVLISFLTAEGLAGRSKSTPGSMPRYSDKEGKAMYRFDLFQEWFARKLAGLTKSGREIGRTPLTQRLTKLQSQNKIFRFGEILAIDIFATTASLLVWTTISKLSAMWRSKTKVELDSADPVLDLVMKDSVDRSAKEVHRDEPEASESRRKILNDGPKTGRDWAQAAAGEQAAAL